MATTKLPSSTSPGESLRVVTPHATDNLPIAPCRALWIGGDGDIEVLARGDTTSVVIKGVSAGTLLAISCISVRSGGTTATDIVAIY